MLVWSRKVMESIRIGDVVVTVLEIRGKRIWMGIDAPRAVRIVRGELEKLTPPMPAGPSPARALVEIIQSQVVEQQAVGSRSAGS